MAERSVTDQPAATLDALFRPHSIAVVGASSDPRKIGGRPVAYLKRGYRGRILPVNPGQAQIQGLPAFPTLDAVPGPVDQAILALPAKVAEASVEACIAKGVRSIVMFTSGLGEVDAAGLARQQAIAARCAAAGVRLLGPNCLGVFNIADGVLSTFSASVPSLRPRAGRIAVVSQSGAFGTYLFTMLAHRDAGFSHFVATGNEADVDVSACVEWLADDPATGVILVSLEGCRDGTRLRRALLRARANRKPVVVMKVGTSELGAAAAASHTGALAGRDSAYQAAFEEAGAWRATSIEEMVDLGLACATAHATNSFPRGGRLGIATISGGVGVLMADAAAVLGLDVPALPGAAQAEILAFAAPRNPVDVTAQVVNDKTLLARVLDVMVSEGGYDTILVFFALMGLADERMMEARDTLLALRARDPARPFVLCLICSPAIRETLEADGFVVMEEPGRAVRACAALAHFARIWQGAVPVLASEPPAPALPGGPLDEAAAKRLLSAAGLPFVPERACTTAADAAAAASELGFPVVLKALSPDLVHKSDVGGVRLGLRSPAEVEAAWDAMMRDVARAAPGARLAGGLVAPMVRGGVEVVIGAHRDPTFGPVCMVGLGGVFVEVFRDVAFRLAPLTEEAALEQLLSIRGRALLDGARGKAAVDTRAVARALAALSRFAAAHAAEVDSVEINPFIALPEGGMAVDAVILRRPAEEASA